MPEIPQTNFLHKMGDICDAVNVAINVEELFEISLKQIMALFGAKRGSIFILNKNGKDLTLEIAQGMESDEKERIVKRMGEGIVGQVAELKQPIFVSDITNDARFQNFKAKNRYLTPSFICAPLIIKDKLIGVINISDKESGIRFTENEMQLLDFLASQVAINYLRIKLYHKFKNVAKETEDLKSKLGQSDQETQYLKKQISIQEKLATIGKLAGGIAHEFNNPLDGVMRYTNLCLEHIHEDEVVRGYLLEVKHGLNRMANIVKNLLACSRNDLPPGEKVDFKQALGQAILAKKSAIVQKNIALEMKIAEELPLIADLGVERILTNLLHNAIDALSNDGKIIVKAKYEHQCLIFSVGDTGSGISHENIEKIFEPFFTTKDMTKGCGLGLTIVGEIVKTYGGKIDVKSYPQKGTTFNVTLPII